MMTSVFVLNYWLGTSIGCKNTKY